MKLGMGVGTAYAAIRECAKNRKEICLSLDEGFYSVCTANEPRNSGQDQINTPRLFRHFKPSTLSWHSFSDTECKQMFEYQVTQKTEATYNTAKINIRPI